MPSPRSRSGRPTAEEAAQLADRIRRAAVDTFLAHGYDGTTMEAVAQAAGVTKSTLYARHADKRELFIAASSWALTRQEPAGLQLEPLPGDLAGALTQIARGILARSLDPALIRLNRMAIAESARFPEFAASSQAVTWTPRIQAIMDLLRRHGVVPADAELAAEQFFAMVGAMPALLAAYGIHRPPEVEEQHLRHAVQLFLNGVLARPTAAPAGFRRLGRDGPYVSPIALGAATLGRDERTATTLIHRYLDAGGNLIDTSAPGAAGSTPAVSGAAGSNTSGSDAAGSDAAGSDAAAEEICGRALRGRRSAVVLATSVTTPDLRTACEASLRRLGTDHLDLLHVRLDGPLEETIDKLDDLVRAGKVLHTGVTSVPAYRLMKALCLSDRRPRARFVSLRERYDPALAREHFPLLAEEGLGFLSAGLPPTSDRAADAIRSAAPRLGCTPAQLALARQRTRPVTSTIIESAQLEDALASLAVEIPPEIAATIID